MKTHIYLALAVMAGSAAAAFAQDSNTIDSHLRAAKTAAEFDYNGTLARTCVLPQTGPGQDVAPGPAPDRSTWFTEPAKVFDNLYFVGTKIYSFYAPTTTE